MPSNPCVTVQSKKKVFECVYSCRYAYFIRTVKLAMENERKSMIVFSIYALPLCITHCLVHPVRVMLAHAQDVSDTPGPQKSSQSKALIDAHTHTHTGHSTLSISSFANGFYLFRTNMQRSRERQSRPTHRDSKWGVNGSNESSFLGSCWLGTNPAEWTPVHWYTKNDSTSPLSLPWTKKNHLHTRNWGKSIIRFMIKASVVSATCWKPQSGCATAPLSLCIYNAWSVGF